MTVELPNGYEGFDATSKRYAINGMVESGDAVDRVEAQMDAAWAGQVVEIGRSAAVPAGSAQANVIRHRDNRGEHC